MSDKDKAFVELGNAPGIHIDGTFYPMRMQKEETPHEVYLRMPRNERNGNNTALKLYANVSQKLFIEHSEIGDDLKGKIREKTLEAAKQRDDRKTKFIDTPPIQPPSKAVKKKKETPLFRNAIRPSDQAKLSASTSSSARVPSPSPTPQLPETSLVGLRERLLRCLTLEERGRDAILRSVAGGESAATQRAAVNLLNELAEPKSPLKKGEDVGNKIWCLKAESWLLVRPKEWPRLTEQQRLHLFKEGKKQLKSLPRLSENDPVWANFKSSKSDGPTMSTAPPKASAVHSWERTMSDLPTRNGITSAEARKPKPKPKPDLGAEIPMKDESLTAKVRVHDPVAKGKEPVALAKRGPGSGFQAGKSNLQNPIELPEVPSNAAISRPKPTEKAMHANRPSITSKGAPAVQTSSKDKTPTEAVMASRIKKLRESDAYFSEVERDRLAKSKGAAEQERQPNVKRKQVLREGPDANPSASVSVPHKKRKTENGSVVPTSSIEPRSRATPICESPQPPPRPRQSKEPSPLPLSLPKINKKSNPPPRPNASAHATRNMMSEASSAEQSSRDSALGDIKVNGKRRRGSPIYTSSEDEGESPKVRRIVSKAPSPPPDANRHKARTKGNERVTRPLPTDHASLRMRYTTTYAQCMNAFTALLAQKTKIDTLLQNGERGLVTDSDGDDELMDAEDLKKLSHNYERLHEELETIRQKFAD
ncbi:hypothetical protein H0H93_008630 [Arthromyces matolae]|nr:hypothetical protein H0H93_008630 [Arthromyces matolae]